MGREVVYSNRSKMVVLGECDKRELLGVDKGKEAREHC